MRTKTRPIGRWALAAAAISAAATVLTACSSSTTGSAPSGTTSAAAPATSAAAPAPSGSATQGGRKPADLLPASYKSAGVIKVASTFGYPPEQFYEEDGRTPTGFSVELGQAMGKVLGVEFTFDNVSFGAILPGIAAGRYDIAITSMSITPTRSKEVNFVKYLEAGGSLLVAGKNPKNINGLADLCGMTVANTTGSLHGDYVLAYSKENCEAKGKAAITVNNFDDAAAPNQAVATGRADACFRDFTANAYMAKMSGGAFKVVGGIVKTQPYGIAVAKDKLPLAEALDAALNQVIADGTYLSILKKWDVSEAALTRSEVVPATG